MPAEGVSITFDLAEGGSNLVVHVSAGTGSGAVVTLIQGPAATSAVAGSEDDGPDLVSHVVDIVIRGAGGANQRVLSGAGGADPLVNVTFGVHPLPLGGGSCTSPTLLGVVFGGQAESASCVAGCCREGLAADGRSGCECDALAIRGARCDRELSCSASAADGRRDKAGCTTTMVDADGNVVRA